LRVAIVVARVAELPVHIEVTVVLYHLVLRLVYAEPIIVYRRILDPLAVDAVEVCLAFASGATFSDAEVGRCERISLCVIHEVLA
jgi:hypothetical protein